MGTLQVQMLGEFSVAGAAGAFGLQSLPAHLLAYLALARGKLMPRHRLAGTLWPDVPEERARANLSTVAWRLKGALDVQGVHPGIVVSSKECLGLDVERCDIDVERFLRSALDPRNPTESLGTIERGVDASRLYRGDLLADWDDEWCLADREALRRRHLGNLQALAESFERRGRLDLALEFAQRAAAAQPLDESLQFIVVRLLMKCGRRASAYSHYNRFASTVRAELGVEPDAQLLRELEAPGESAAALRSTTSAGSLPALLRPNRLPLVGRSTERQVLASLLDTAIADGGASVLLTGEAGVGKSRLVNWIMEEWTARGGASGRGACVEFNEPIPFQPLFDALDGVTDAKELGAFLAHGIGHPHLYPSEAQLNSPGFEGGDPPALPRDTLRLFAWLKEKVSEACRRRPLMIVVEDLQWVDGGTLGFLNYLTAHDRNMRLAVVLTSRPERESANRFKMDRLSRNCTTVLNLGRLAKRETAELVSQILEGKATSSEFLSWLQIETEGNPLFVIETLRLLSQRGSFDVPGDATSPLTRRLAIPDGVRSVVDQRLAHLEPAELRVAKVASVLGRTSDDELLAMVAGLSLNTLSRHVAGLLEAGILERDGAGYRFTHDKIREVCYESLSVAARRARHLRAAAVLGQRSDVPSHSLAWHQACAGQWTLATASWATAGDKSREVYAYEEALQSYQQAIACLLRDDRLGARDKATKEFLFLSKSAEVVAALGRPKQQHAIHRRMEAICQQIDSDSLTALLYLRKAWLAGHEADFNLALRLGRRAWALAKRAADLGLQVKALHVVARQLNRLGRNKRSLQMYRVALTRDNGAPSAIRASLLDEMALVFARSGNLAAAEASLMEARQVRRKIGRLESDATSLVLEINIRYSRASARVSMAVVKQAAEVAARTDDVVLSMLVNSQMVRVNTLGGRLGDALRTVRIARVLARTTGSRRTLAGCLNEVANGVGRVIGSYRWAGACVEQALQLSKALGTPLLSAVCLDSQAMILMELGKYDLALEKIQAALAVYEANEGSLGPSRESLGRRGAIQLLRGDIDSALRDLDEAAQSQSRSGDRVILTDTLSYLALAYARAGDQQKALATSDEALRVLEEIEWTGYQPQRVFWHHYQILERLGREPRVNYLQRAVEFIDAQAATVSKVQAKRLRTNVPLNRAILSAWARASTQATQISPNPELASAAG